MAKRVGLKLVGSREAAHLIGVWPDSFSRLRRQGKVPEPDWQLHCGPVWLRTTIEQWARDTGRL